MAKGVIRSRKSEKDRQRNGQSKNNKMINNDTQNTIQKTKDRATRTPLNTGGKGRCSGRVGNSRSTSGTVVANTL
jgi:hypothetical protein